MPARHCKHTDGVVAPDAVEYDPASHELHAAEPDCLLYLPAAQITHIPPLGPT